MYTPPISRPTGRFLLVGLVVAAVVAGSTGVAAAQSASRTGGTVVIGSGETVDGDLRTFGGTVVVRGTVDGDLEAFAGSVVIADSGRVAGGLQASGGSVSIYGTVDGTVEGSAGSALLGSTGTVGGDLRVAAGELHVAGTVDGDVEAAVETLRLASTAAIGGDVGHGRTTELVREDGATVGGSVTPVDDLAVGGGIGDGAAPSGPAVDLLFGVYGAVVTFVFGAVLLLVFPGFSSAVAAEVDGRPLRSGGVGIVGLVGIPLALVAIAITIVGVPLTLVGFMALGLVVFVSVVLAQYAVGRWAVSLAGVDNRWAALLVGVVGVAVLSRLPVVGRVVNLAVFLLGFGAVLVALYRGYRGRRRDDSRRGSAGPAPPSTN